MKRTITLLMVGVSTVSFASEYTTPACYKSMPTSCGFDEMTLSLCNLEGKASGATFSLSGRSYLPGGNKFVSRDGARTCMVERIKGTEPAKYSIQVI